MPRRESGEFEVLLGNKQLLSIFFIVVILLGVFFTMGYILGRNSKPAETTPVAQAANPVPQQEGGQSAFRGSSSFQPLPAQAPPASPVAAEPAPPPAAPPAAAEPAPGQTFLQVAAVGRPEAELVADVLKKKGFPSLLAAHPTEPVFRVLVGPLADADAIAKTRSALQDAGFKPILRKY